MTTPDYSAERDATAKDPAEERSGESGAKLDALERMVHGMKGEMTANSALTKLALDGVDKLEGRMGQITTALERISENTSGLVALSENVERSATILCKAARAVDWIIGVATGKLGKFSLVVWAIYMVAMQRKLPEWFASIFKALV